MNRSVAIGAGVVAVILAIGVYLSAFTVSMRYR